MPRKRRLFAILLVAFSLLAITGSIQSNGGSILWNYVADTVIAVSLTGTGTIVIVPSTSLSITSRTISSTNCGTSCGSANNLPGNPPAVNVNTEYWFSTSITDNGGLPDMDNVAIYLFKASNAAKANFDQQRSYGFRWIRQYWSGESMYPCSDAQGCWQELTGNNAWSSTGGPYVYLNPGDSSHTGIGTVKAGVWTFALQFSKVAQYTSSNMDWNFEVDLRNNAGSTISSSGAFDVNLYVSISMPSSINFGTLTSGQNNVPLPSNPYAITYTGNAQLQLQAWSPSAYITNEFGYSISVSNLYIGKNPTPDSTGFDLSTSPQTFTSMPVAFNQNQNMYWYVSTPDPFPPGTYTFTYIISVDYQTWAT